MLAEDVVLLLLAAGRATRFAGGDKLAQLVGAEPLGFHVVHAVAGLPFKARIAVTSETDLDYGARGFRVVANPAPERGQSSSLALGIAAAAAANPLAVLILLADMPCVHSAHIRRLLAAASGTDAIWSSFDGIKPGPPALIGRDHFAELGMIEGDRGARALIRRGQFLDTEPGLLIDIDTREDMEALRAQWAGPKDG